MNEPHDPNLDADSPLGSADSLRAADPTTIDHVPGPASTDGSHPGADSPATDLPAVPGYRVRHEIARGGMGRVVAAYDLGLDRDVALKILLPGANSDRFVREAKITARLPHPGIPPVHALGTLADGSPFLAMKLIAGHTLVEEMKRADRPRLLQAFLQVCQAVGFAHSRGIIHRDLKPANVMVGAFGEVQVMDWGLAKEVAGRKVADGPRSSEPLAGPLAGTDPNQTTDDRAAAESTDDPTQAGTVLGTPAYMAPEQARGEATDARADVFALGGILCALLTGMAPFSGKSSREVIQRAAAADLAAAHARLDGCGADAEVVALCRHCLSPSRVDRPTNGQAVADGITAYLNGVQESLRAAEVARAAEASRAEEATRTAAEANERAKAERRARRVQVIAASLLLLVLAGGIVGTTLGLFRAEQAKEQAVKAEGETKKRADELQQVSDFQAQMLHQVDPASAGLRLSADVKAKFEAALTKAGVPPGERAQQAEAFASQWSRVNATDAALAAIDSTILKPALAAIDKQFKDQPVLDAALRQTLAEGYLDLGLYDAAKPLLERALETRRRVLGGEHPDTLRSVSHLGNLLKDQGKRSEALLHYREALDTSRRVLGDDHADTLSAISNVGALLINMGKVDEAAPYLREALDRRRRLHGEDSPATLSAMSDMGLLLKSQGKLGEAAASYREVLEKRRRALGAGHPDTISSVSSLGSLLTEQGQVNEAAECFREVLEELRRRLGEVHPATLRAASDLGDTFSRLGKYVEAEALMREALADKQRLLGADHPSTLITLSNLAVFLIQRGRGAEAEPLCLESLEKNRRVSGPEHPNTLVATNVVGFLYLNLKKPAQAEPYIREIIALSRRINGEEHPDTLTYTHNLGTVLLDQDKLSDAEANLRTVAEKGGRALGKEHPITLSASVKLGDLLSRQRRHAEAAQLFAALEPSVRKSTTPAGKGLLAILLKGLGTARTGLKEFEAAEANLLEAHPIRVKMSGEAHAETRSCVQAIVDLYTAWHTAQPGKGYDTRAAEWKAKLPKETVPPPQEKN
jgi:serine/threonine protein kinase/tetratricopeptide (TPR) repeat protein